MSLAQLAPEKGAPSPEADEGDSWEVESIRMMMMEGQKEYFLVKWQDWPYSQMTWEPLSNLPLDKSGYVQLETNFQRDLYNKKLKVSQLVSQRVSHQKMWNYFGEFTQPSKRRLVRHLRDFYIAEVHRRDTNCQKLFCQIAAAWKSPHTAAN